jgi:hypothetical protein
VQSLKGTDQTISLGVCDCRYQRRGMRVTSGLLPSWFIPKEAKAIRDAAREYQPERDGRSNKEKHFNQVPGPEIVVTN